MINVQEFKELIKEIVQQETKDATRYKIGTIANISGKPTVTFAGESDPSKKRYPFLNGYVPKEGDRVLLARVKGTYIIIDKIMNEPSSPIWHDMNLKNDVESWGNSNKPRYCKIGHQVFISGAVKNISENNTVIAKLPNDYRPEENYSFVQLTSAISGESHFARWIVTKNGNLEMEFINREHSNSSWFPIDTNFIV